MNTGQTAPRAGAVWSGSILFATQASKVYLQIREQMTIVAKGKEKKENVQEKKFKS